MPRKKHPAVFMTEREQATALQAANSWQAYIKGWKVGARSAAPDPQIVEIPEGPRRYIAFAYNCGYADGLSAFSEAQQAASLKYGHWPSILRKRGK